MCCVEIDEYQGQHVFPPKLNDNKKGSSFLLSVAIYNIRQRTCFRHVPNSSQSEGHDVLSLSNYVFVIIGYYKKNVALVVRNELLRAHGNHGIPSIQPQ